MDETATASETVAPGGDPAAATFESALTQGIELLMLGGPVVMLLLVLSVMTLAIAFIKVVQFARHGVWTDGDVDLALRIVDEGRRGDALQRLDGKRHVVASVIAEALRGARPDDNADAFRERLAAYAQARLETLRSELRMLELIGNISPLLGLLGTILGMIKAFRELERAGAQVDPSLLSGGIWEALLTTAVGIIVAIPAVVLYNLFDRAHERVTHRIEWGLSCVLHGHSEGSGGPRADLRARPASPHTPQPI